MTTVTSDRRRAPFMLRVRNRVERLLRDLKRNAQRRAPGSRLSAEVHRALVTRELSREAAAVAAGQLRYARDLKADLPSYFLLRRNVHRLEKGLIMRPRRPVFAADYIEETVRIYQRACAAAASSPTEQDELVWAGDVLDAYFRAVEPGDARVDAARGLFEQTAQAVRGAGEAVPYRRNLSVPPPVDIEAFEQLCRRRRSVRWYLDRPIPRDMVDRAVAAALQAPSACNRQPFVFRLFDDPQIARRIAGIALGTKGFGHALPAVAVVVGRLRAYPLERDRHAIYVDGALAAMSFIYGLEAQGLASCAINWADQEPEETRMRKALNLDADERVIMLIAYGWPDPEGMVPYSAKRPLSQARTYNQL